MWLTDILKGEKALLEKGKKHLRNKDYKDYNKALHYFNKVLKKNKNNFPAAYNKGIVFIKQENYNTAGTYFEILLKERPKHKQVLQVMAFLLGREKKYRKADKCYERILKLKKHSENLPILDKRIKLLDTSIKYLSEYGRADENEIKKIKEKIIDCSNKILVITSKIENYEKDEKTTNIQNFADEMKSKYISDLANN